MKNLKIFCNSVYDHEIIKKSSFLIFGKQCAFESSPKQSSFLLFCLTDFILFSIQNDTVKELFDLRAIFSEEKPKAVHMWYKDIYDVVCICFENGQVISLSIHSNGAEIQEERSLGFLVKDIIWSPAEEAAVLVTSSSQIILLDFDFNILADVDVFDTSTGEKELMNVGWGRKETQFHGSEGKGAALKSPELFVSSQNEGNNSLHVTWRGDGTLFAVGYWCPEKKFRRVKIYNNEGSLQCTSEEISGVEEPLCWKPQGNLITFSQQLPNKYVIAFMEKNGLKHGEFPLPSNLKVKDLLWNEASTILCMVCLNETTQEKEILLWTTGNYHWYLKQRFSLLYDLKNIWWDKVNNNQLNILSNGGLHVMEWDFTVNTSYLSSCEDQAYVAVINGNEVLLTAFKEAIIPPPMSSYKLQFPKAVNRVIFPPLNCEEKLLLAILCDGSVAVTSNVSSEPHIFCDTTLTFKSTVLALGHWEWVHKDMLIFCTSGLLTSEIVVWELDDNSLLLKSKSDIPGKIITCNRAEDKLVIQTSDGKLINYDYCSNSFDTANFSLPEVSSDIKIHPSGLYALSNSRRVYIDGSQTNLPSLSGTSVTSYLLKDPYILLTTSSHQLIILKYENKKCVEVSKRKIERGSRLITTCGNSVILQAARGNLETIQPRALTILTVGEMIDSKMYKSALYLMRKQRIDLNLIVDHNREGFINDVQLFIKEVDPQWITLLITELNDEDVTKTSYSLYYKLNTHEMLPEKKVKTICEKLLSVMTANDDLKKEYILPILSALVKVNNMSLALELANSEQALQHLLFIVDVNKLYSEALGIYDLNAALKIAEKSHMDPKEYVPYLNSLRKMEPNYMKFMIDKSLNKLESALAHLAKCSREQDEECINFVKNNSLFASALKLFKDDTERCAIIADLYGEHLYKERFYEESGIMFIRAGNSDKAIQSFTRAYDWQQCLLIVKKNKYSNEKSLEIGKDVCTMLSSSHKFYDAGAVCLEWLSDPVKAIEMYIQGKHWKEATYTAQKYELPELLIKVKEALLEAVEALIESISGNKEKMEKYVSRLQVVRVEKKNRPAFIYDDFSDTASDTSSTSSLRTKSFQSRSSKNTKKMNRKMWSLKEGNPREEGALVATLTQLSLSAEKCVGDVNYTCSVLLTFDEDTVAASLQNEMKQWLKVIDDSKKIIWPRDPEMIESALQDEKFKFPPELTIMSRWEFESLKSS